MSREIRRAVARQKATRLAVLDQALNVHRKEFLDVVVPLIDRLADALHAGKVPEALLVSLELDKVAMPFRTSAGKARATRIAADRFAALRKREAAGEFKLPPSAATGSGELPTVFTRPECPFNYCDSPPGACYVRCRHAPPEATAP